VSVRNWLLERARLWGAEEALRFGGRRISFEALADLSLRGAGQLRRWGVRNGDLVAVLLGNGLDFVQLVHAVSLCGARFLPLNTRLMPEELVRQLRASRATHFVFGSGELGERARAMGRELQGLESAAFEDGLLEGLANPGDAGALAEHIDPEEIFAVLFTSGTSTAPKGVCLTHGNLQASAFAAALHLGLHRDDRWLACLPLFHVGGLSILMRNVLLGSPVLIHERFDPERVSAAIDDGITHVSLVPTMLGRLLEVREERPPPASLRGILLGGAAAPPVLLERARKLGFPLLPTYGLTEACSQVATFAPGDSETGSQEIGGVGRALFGTEIRIADAAGRAVPPGREGEILVRGPTVMAGYLGDSEETDRALRDGWLHTGDVGVLDSEGRLRVLDRRADLIVSGGENVSPAEVEAVLREHCDVEEVGVAGIRDPDLGSRVTAWVVPRAGARLRSGDLRAFCRGRLAGFKVPKEIRFTASLPRNSSGKLLRRCLQQLGDGESPREASATETPRASRGRRIAGRWPRNG
jgi:O-succinylbenzoic acid--CoA ligase